MAVFFRRIVFVLFNRMLECSTRGWISCVIPKTSTVLGFTLIDEYSLIGKYTYINRFCEITSATIGNYCSIGSGVRIGSGEHDYSLLTTSAVITEHTAKELTVLPCDIGHDVWIGTQAFIKRGIKIGNGAIIGAHAVVTKDVPDFAIVVGNPAKVIRYRFPEEVRNIVLSSEWWNQELDQAKQTLNGLQIDG